MIDHIVNQQLIDLAKAYETHHKAIYDASSTYGLFFRNMKNWKYEIYHSKACSKELSLMPTYNQRKAVKKKYFTIHEIGKKLLLDRKNDKAYLKHLELKNNFKKVVLDLYAKGHKPEDICEALTKQLQIRHVFEKVFHWTLEKNRITDLILRKQAYLALLGANL